MKEEIVQGALSRYDMSYPTFRQLQRDYIRFEQKHAERFVNSFICRILINYMEYAQDNFLEQFDEDVSSMLQAKTHRYYHREDRLSFTKELTEKMLEFDFTSRDDFRKRSVITYIIERFATLHLSEREMIYCYLHYKTILDAIEKKEILVITNTSGKEFEAKSLCLEVDDNSGSYYLIAYSRFKGNDTGYECHPFKLSRIKQCKSKHKEYSLTNKERISANEIIEKFGYAYMTNNISKKDIENIVVRLTKMGYEELFLKIIAHQRPIPVSEPQYIEMHNKTFYELEFDCSHNQIRNYFFSFGADAEIISPSWLRERFFKEYRMALERYLS